MEYTDFYGRVWYSDAFCVVKPDKETYVKVENDVTIPPVKGEKDMLGWKEALLRLPIGVIDIDVGTTLLKCKANDDTTGYTCTMTINLSQISGRQKPIKLITHSNFNNQDSKYKTTADYHGMSKNELEEIYKDKFSPYIPTGTISYNSLSGVSPTSCSSSGICNKATGNCECFSGFTGIACSDISESV